MLTTRNAVNLHNITTIIDGRTVTRKVARLPRWVIRQKTRPRLLMLWRNETESGAILCHADLHTFFGRRNRQLFSNVQDFVRTGFWIAHLEGDERTSLGLRGRRRQPIATFETGLFGDSIAVDRSAFGSVLAVGGVGYRRYGVFRTVGYARILQSSWSSDC